MADKKTTQLTERTNGIFGTDLIAIVGNTATVPINLKVQVKNLFSQLAVDFPQTTFSAFKITANVSANATSAVLGPPVEFALQSNSSIGVTVQDRVGLIVRNEIGNGNSNITGRMWGLHIKLDSANSNAVSANTFGLVIEHGLNTNVAAGHIVAPRAFIALKEQAGSGNTTTYLVDVGAQSNTVSADLANVNSSVIFSKANVTTITQKLKVRINGTDYWIPVTAAV